MTQNTVIVANGFVLSASGIVEVVSGSATPQVATPTFSLAAGSYTGSQHTSISCATTGASIYYTTDGSQPSYPATGSTSQYTGTPVLINQSLTVNAIGVLTGYTNSSVGSAAYTITTPQVATPSISPGSGTYSGTQTISMSCTTTGASIYYTTDNSTPTQSSNLYSGSFNLTSGSVTYTAKAFLSGYTASNTYASTVTISSGAATNVFNYPNGFTAVAPFTTGGSGAQLSGTSLIIGVTNDNHTSAGMWYAPQNNASWTTQFSFNFANLATPSTAEYGICVSGFTFGMQNSTAPPGGAGFVASGAAGDANCSGWGTYSPLLNSAQGGSINLAVAIKFDCNFVDSIKFRPTTGSSSSTGLYLNPGGYTNAHTLNIYGGPYGGLDPSLDLNPYGINFYTTHNMAVKMVYDGTYLTMVIQDTVTFQQARFVWKVNINPIVAGSTSYVGFTQGQADEPTGATLYLNSWSFWEGYNTRLNTPTVSSGNPPGSYSGVQTVTLAQPSNGGNSASIYYTTNGLLPTSSTVSGSTLYTGPISITANTILQWVAIENGFTDSYVGGGLYQINSSHTINIASGGFVNGCGVVPVGYAEFTGGALLLLDQTSYTFINAANFAPYMKVANAWWATPVAVTSNWTTTFVFTCTGNADGFTFIIQSPYFSYNSPEEYTWGLNNGPFITAPGVAASLGYGGYTPSGNTGGLSSPGILNSLAIKFQIYNGPLVGLYLNGALPEDNNGTAITGVTITNGSAVTCTFTYTASTNTLAMQLTQGSNTYTQNFSVNIASALNGSSTATVGFGAASGGATSNLEILSWTGF